ncbi:Uncharacterized conserved protein YafD, endonuclease/exonuclease/phosphatase (EEP) superfamily [Kytococcus aerolatus]|uniref:Uncharacterized conserved protein YafD, endonuclease/exonuclease/phosphatase (EEP) superfamily n=1 Tax=Kytococcus aerolatus TaxID=592308 RepID=A0A212U113_9MICO|nr:endonuclease/exonuclease/phosphatase family protein [Kytococcus aerolatus]SNC71932.1 Uncharacterized conserved protein YafD, endonuclease/exonuclease/phosphatase (EEP) superfamily [Kytococcus aerolatus]
MAWRTDVGRVTPGQVLGGVLALVCGLGALLLAVLAWAPDLALSRRATVQPGVAQAIAFPVPLGVGVLLVSALVLGAALLVRRCGGGPLASAFALAAVPGLLAGTGFVAHPDGPPWTRVHSPEVLPTIGQEASDGSTLSVVTYNSLMTLTGEDLDELEGRFQPDAVVLPETSPERAQRAVDAAGWPGTVVSHGPEGRDQPMGEGVEQTSVLLRDGLPEYRSARTEPSMLGNLRLEPRAAGYPVLLGVHYAPPVPGFMGTWRDDLSRSLAEAEQAATTGPVLLAGDLNATPRHGGMARLEGLVDTARECGRAEGTWPSDWPAWGRSAIDHVLVSEGAEVLSCQALRLSGSDHLAYATTVRFPG